MVRDIKIQLNPREFDHIEEHDKQSEKIYLDVMRSITVNDPEAFTKAMAEFTTFYFKLGEQYIWRYHA